MKGRRIEYSEAELAWIERNSTRPRREAHGEFVERFSRPDVQLTNFVSLCKRNGWLTGRTGRYEKGRAPENKGKRMAYNARSAANQFRPGHVPKNLRPLWSERVGKDGYVEMKVPVENPYTGSKTRYMHKHRYLWEQVNGPLPEGMCLKAIDGDKTNTDPSNWEAIPRAMLPRLNGRFGRDYDSAPDELKPLIFATARLEHAAREARKK